MTDSNHYFNIQDTIKKHSEINILVHKCYIITQSFLCNEIKIEKRTKKALSVGKILKKLIPKIKKATKCNKINKGKRVKV